MQKPITMNLSISQVIHHAELVVGMAIPTADRFPAGPWSGRRWSFAGPPAMQRYSPLNSSIGSKGPVRRPEIAEVQPPARDKQQGKSGNRALQNGSGPGLFR